MLPQNWAKFKYHGAKRHVVNWRTIHEDRNGTYVFAIIGMELRKNGKFSNKIKRFNLVDIVGLSMGNIEDGIEGPAFYIEGDEVSFGDERAAENTWMDPELRETINQVSEEIRDALSEERMTYYAAENTTSVADSWSVSNATNY